MTQEQLMQLGTALDAIHQRFSAAYGPLAGQSGFYAMECEFKYDNDANPTLPPSLYVIQARLYAGPGRDIAGASRWTLGLTAQETEKPTGPLPFNRRDLSSRSVR